MKRDSIAPRPARGPIHSQNCHCPRCAPWRGARHDRISRATRRVRVPLIGFAALVVWCLFAVACAAVRTVLSTH